MAQILGEIAIKSKLLQAVIIDVRVTKKSHGTELSHHLVRDLRRAGCNDHHLPNRDETQTHEWPVEFLGDKDQKETEEGQRRDNVTRTHGVTAPPHVIAGQDHEIRADDARCQDGFFAIVALGEHKASPDEG